MKSLIQYILESKGLSKSQLDKLTKELDKYLDDPKKPDNWHDLLKTCRAVSKNATYHTDYFMEVTFYKHDAKVDLYDIPNKVKYEWSYDDIEYDDNIAFNKNDLDDRFFLLKGDRKYFVMYLPDELGEKVKRYYHSKLTK